MAHRQPVRNETETAREIPDKLYFRIGEVARLCDVPAYVLRFWESEFPQLRPNKGGTGQRLYRKRDVEMALRVKHLLYDEGYTIPGARQLLRGESRQRDPQMVLVEPEIEAAPDRDGRDGPAEEPLAGLDRQRLAGLRSELRDLLRVLSWPADRGRPVPVAVPRSKQLFGMAGDATPERETGEE